MPWLDRKTSKAVLKEMDESYILIREIRIDNQDSLSMLWGGINLKTWWRVVNLMRKMENQVKNTWMTCLRGTVVTRTQNWSMTDDWVRKWTITARAYLHVRMWSDRTLQYWLVALWSGVTNTLLCLLLFPPPKKIQVPFFYDKLIAPPLPITISSLKKNLLVSSVNLGCCIHQSCHPASAWLSQLCLPA